MLRYTLKAIEFHEERAQTLTCGYYDEDRPASNYLSLDIIHEIDYLDLDKDLSFILIQSPSLQLCGFITVKVEDYNNRPKGIKIHSIGYTDIVVFNYIINQLKLKLAIENNLEGERKFDYIWGYEYEDFTYLTENFNIDYQNNIFISELQR